MSRMGQDQLIVPSILDRLVDDEPDGGQEAPRNRFQNLRDLKASVLRDLQNLLNTRCHHESWPPGIDQLETSVVNYGLPDLSGENFSDTKRRDSFAQLMERVIRRFEPRFLEVKVTFIASPDRTDRTVRFRIDAKLKADPVPEQMIFDSAVEPSTGTFEVAGATS